MTTAIVLLFANAAFNLVVWPRFYARVVKDPRARDAAGKPTKFLMVHVFLFSAGLVLAAASIFAAIVLLVS